MRIADVRVEGALNTRQSFLGSLINPVLSKPANNLGDVLHTTRHISHLLKKADIFKHVEARLERSSSDLANPYDVDVVFKTREHGRYYLNTSTELGNNEGSAVCRTPEFLAFCLYLFQVGNRPYQKCLWWRRDFRGQHCGRDKN